MTQHYRLVIACPDRVGIVSTVSQFISSQGGGITEANQYAEHDSGWFFMRYEIDADSLPFDVDGFRERFSPIAEEFKMEWRVTDTAKKPKVLIMASKQDHCLTDLLYRWKCGDMDFELPCVIDNHDDLRGYVEWHDVPYHHVPVPKDAEGKSAAFARTAELIEEYQPDLIVLARYMQVLPPWMCEQYAGRVINIHHSFLPSFSGAKPYHQAKERGVKLSGATCHYVTQDLDEGPIIEQDVIRIGHHHTAEDMVRLGKDVEKQVLSRGLRYHLEDRVLIHGNKTIVFA